ncbi:MAG: aspartyl protease family protein [Phycisphaerales bacterium JB040]
MMLRALAPPLLLVLGACAGASCPEPVPMGTLPETLTDRFDTGPAPATLIRRSPDGGLVVTLEDRETVRAIATAPQPVVLPIARRGEHWTVPATVVSVDGARSRVEFKIDTGAQTQLTMNAASATRLGVTIPAELTPAVTHTAFGPKRVRDGVLSELRLGTASIRPVGVEVECTGQGYTPLLGVRVLERFGHAIFDWERATLTLLPRGSIGLTEGAASDPGWTSTPWTRETVSLRRDSIEFAGSGSRSVVVEMSARWARLSLDGTDRVTLLDTGFSGDLFAFQPVELEATTRGTVVGQGFGRSAVFRTEELARPVVLAGIGLRGITLIEPLRARESLDLVQSSGYECMAGLGILERHAMWLDFERDRVRFWVGPGSMPRVVSE